MLVFSWPERSQTRSGGVQRGIALGDAKPHDTKGRRLLIEGSKRNCRQLNLCQQPFRKQGISRRGHLAEVQQLEIGALRRRQLKRTPLESGAQPITLRLEKIRERGPGIRLLEQITRNRVL